MIKLTERQQEIVDSNVRVKLVMGGHRSGKTVTAIINMWEEMKRQNNPDFKAIFLVKDIRFMNYIDREIGHILPIESLISKRLYLDYCICYKTVFGEIYISTRLLGFPFDSVTIDNVTSNKYATDYNIRVVWRDSKVFMCGHIPQDIQNTYFKLWLKSYFDDDPEVKSFRLEGLFDKEHLDEIKVISGNISRFNRDYLCIPDFVHDSDKT